MFLDTCKSIIPMNGIIAPSISEHSCWFTFFNISFKKIMPNVIIFFSYKYAYIDKICTVFPIYEQVWRVQSSGLQCHVVRKSSMVWRNIPPPSSGLKSRALVDIHSFLVSCLAFSRLHDIKGQIMTLLSHYNENLKSSLQFN
jgi:hypothetical protein